jgi:hypothetical protein
MLSWNFRLEMYQLLLNGTGPGGAFGYADHHVAQHGALILSLAMLVAGVVVMIAGANSQRIAFLATAAVLILWVAVRQLAPAIVMRGAKQRDPVVREREYLGTQAGYSRRAYGTDHIVLDDSSAIYPSLDSALAATALWDDAMLRLAIEPRTVLDTNSAWVGWRPSPRGPIADVVRRDADPNGTREVWTVTAVDAAAADPSGDIVPISNPLARLPAGERLVRPPLVYPGAQSYDVIADSSHRVVGVPIDSRVARIAHAWSLQSPQFVAGHLAEPRPTLVEVRDVRERVGRLTPFFVQGTFVTPMIVADTIYWAVDLYSASDWYPLSISIQAVGEEWRYFRHAAVAVVDGFSGDVMIVPDDLLDPLARVWVHRFQSLFTTEAALPAGIRQMLPPATDQLQAQALVFGRFGSTTQSAETRHPADASDTARFVAPPIALTRDHRSVSTALPLLDSTQHVRGTLVTFGGGRRRLAWYAAPQAGPRWGAITERLEGLDSTTGRRAPRLLHRVARPVPIEGRLAYLQPVFSLPVDDSPAFAYVALLSADSAQKASPARRDGSTPSGDVRGQVQAIYAAMRAALQRNDWIAFGRAMDALSRIAGNPPGAKR